MTSNREALWASRMCRFGPRRFPVFPQPVGEAKGEEE